MPPVDKSRFAVATKLRTITPDELDDLLGSRIGGEPYSSQIRSIQVPRALRPLLQDPLDAPPADPALILCQRLSEDVCEIRDIGGFFSGKTTISPQRHKNSKNIVMFRWTYGCFQSRRSRQSVRKRSILKKATSGSKNIRFSELVSLVEEFGFRQSRVKGSHHIFVHPSVPELINLQNVHGKAKPYQVRQLLDLVERYNLKLEDNE